MSNKYFIKELWKIEYIEKIITDDSIIEELYNVGGFQGGSLRLVGIFNTKENYEIFCCPKYLSDELINDANSENEDAINVLREHMSLIVRVLDKLRAEGENIEEINYDFSIFSMNSDKKRISRYNLANAIVTDYLENGIYYRTEKEIKATGRGKIRWGMTMRKVEPIISKENVIYPTLLKQTDYKNYDEKITEIHKNVVLQCIEYLQQLGEKLTIEKPVIMQRLKKDNYVPYIKRCMATSFTNRELLLFKAMISWCDISPYYKGMGCTTCFQNVWEWVNDSVWGTVPKKNLKSSVPKFYFGGRDYKGKGGEEPDTLAHVEGKKDDIVVFDSKYYIPNIPKFWDESFIEGLPRNSDIVKQIAYLNGIKEACGVDDSIRYSNIFLLPECQDYHTLCKFDNTGNESEQLWKLAGVCCKGTFDGLRTELKLDIKGGTQGNCKKEVDYIGVALISPEQLYRQYLSVGQVEKTQITEVADAYHKLVEERNVMKFSDWIKSTEKLKIVVTNRIANVNRMCRILNINDNYDIKQVKPLTLSQIAQEILCAHAAFTTKTCDFKIVGSKTGTYIIDNLLRQGCLSFIPKQCLCMKTSEEVFRTLNQIRYNILTEKALENDKIKALKKLCEDYERKLADMKMKDEARLLKEATDVVNSVASDTLVLYIPWIANCCFGQFKDYEMTNLEQSFFDSICQKVGKSVEKLSYFDKKDTDITYRFFKAYGMANETEYIIDCIENEKLAYGNVNVMYTSNEYESYIRSAFECKGIPYKIVTGTDLLHTEVVKFILDILEWAKDDYLYEKLAPVVDNQQITFKNVCKDEKKRPSYYYNRYLSLGIGWGKERYEKVAEEPLTEGDDEKKNALFNEFLMRLLGVFEDTTNCGKVYEGLLDLCKNYIRRNKFNNSVIAILKEQTEILSTIDSSNINAFDCIKEHLKTLQMEESSETSAVSVMRVSDFEVLERPYNFVIGLNSKHFSDRERESVILTDAELKQFVPKAQCARDFALKVRENLSAGFDTLVKGSIILGYSFYDTVDLREYSPSMFYMDYLEQYGGEVQEKSYSVFNQSIIIDKESFDVRITEDLQGGDTEETTEELTEENAEETTEELTEENAGETTNEVAETDTEETAEETIDDGKNMIKTSSTKLQVLLSCPLKYYYNYVENLPKREFIKKRNYEWLTPLSRGNLFHYVMEKYCREYLGNGEVHNKQFSYEEFNSIYEYVIQQIQEEQMPYVSKDAYDREKEENKQVINNFLKAFHEKMNRDASYNNKKWRILGCEVAFDNLLYCLKDGDKEIKLSFTGAIDRVDGYVDVNKVLHIRVIDYKTGKRENFKTDKQIQHFVYALAIEKYVKEQEVYIKEIYGLDKITYEIEDVCYVFPYETEPELSVKEKISDNMDEGSKTIKFPQEVQNMLINVLSDIGSEDKKSNLEKIVECDAKIGRNLCKYCNYIRQCRCHTGNEF